MLDELGAWESHQAGLKSQQATSLNHSILICKRGLEIVYSLQVFLVRLDHNCEYKALNTVPVTYEGLNTEQLL